MQRKITMGPLRPDLTIVLTVGSIRQSIGPFKDAEELKAVRKGMSFVIDALKPSSDYERQRKATTRPNKTNSLPVGVLQNGGRFRARIRINGKHVSLGQFGTAQEARNAYLVALANKHNQG